MARHNTVAIQMVHLILDGLRERQGDVAGALRRAGISAALLDSPSARVSCEQYAALMRTLRRLTRDEIWGLGRMPVTPGSFSAVCERLIHSPTLGSALKIGISHYRLLIADFAPRLHAHRDRVALTLHRRTPPEGRHDFLGATFLFYAIQVLSWLAGRSVPILHMEVASSRASYDGTVARLIGAPVYYDTGVTSLSFDAAWLSRPVVQDANSLALFLQQVPGTLIRRYQDPVCTSERVRHALARFLGGPLPSMADIATLLHISPATLRRRLQDEQQSFQQIKDELRRDAALEQLQRGQKSVHSVAAYLGFSEPSTFHRAFKQWTGIAPGEYRLRHAPPLRPQP